MPKLTEFIANRRIRAGDLTASVEAVAQYAKGDCAGEVALLQGGLEEEDRLEPGHGEGDEDEADGRGERDQEARRRRSQDGHSGGGSVLPENERGRLEAGDGGAGGSKNGFKAEIGDLCF